MPPTKRQRSSRGPRFGIYEDSESSGPDSPRPHKNARKVSAGDDKENQGYAHNDATKERTGKPVELISLTPHHGCGGGFQVSECEPDNNDARSANDLEWKIQEAETLRVHMLSSSTL
jgi:hypothetical protein